MFLKTLISFLFIFSSAFAQESSHKVVYDLTTKDVKVFEKKILQGVVAHKNYYEGKFEELEVAIVIHGGSYKFFLKSMQEKDLQKRVLSLAHNYHVSFYICKIGLAKRHIKEENVLSFVHIVPNSTIALIDKQNEGFAYIPVAH